MWEDNIFAPEPYYETTLDLDHEATLMIRDHKQFKSWNEGNDLALDETQEALMLANSWLRTFVFRWMDWWEN